MTARTPFMRMFANVIGGPKGVFFPRRASSRDRPRAMRHVLTKSGFFVFSQLRLFPLR
jgi:hypothetical protein